MTTSRDGAERKSAAGASATGELPPLPPVKAGLAHAVVPGTIIFFIVFVVLLVALDWVRQNDHLLWLWTALAGWILGLIGLAIYSWQRRAARRGSRGASAMALDEEL